MALEELEFKSCVGLNHSGPAAHELTESSGQRKHPTPRNWGPNRENSPRARKLPPKSIGQTFSKKVNPSELLDQPAASAQI